MVYAHLVVEDLALAGLGLWNEAVVEHIEHILADLLELGLDLLAVVADDADVLVRALGLLLLLDAGDDAPRGTTCSDDVLVGYREEVALVDCQFAANLGRVLVVGGFDGGRVSFSEVVRYRDVGWELVCEAYLCDFLHHMLAVHLRNACHTVSAHLHVANHLCNDKLARVAPEIRRR